MTTTKTKTYTRRQMIEDISVLEDGRIIRFSDPDQAHDAMWDSETKRWVPIPTGTMTCGDFFDGRDLNPDEIRTLTEAGAIPAR